MVQSCPAHACRQPNARIGCYSCTSWSCCICRRMAVRSSFFISSWSQQPRYHPMLLPERGVALLGSPSGHKDPSCSPCWRWQPHFIQVVRFRAHTLSTPCLLPCHILGFLMPLGPSFLSPYSECQPAVSQQLCHTPLSLHKIGANDLVHDKQHPPRLQHPLAGSLPTAQLQLLPSTFGLGFQQVAIPPHRGSEPETLLETRCLTTTTSLLDLDVLLQGVLLRIGLLHSRNAQGLVSPYRFIEKETYFIRNLICILREAKKIFVRSSPGSREEALCSEHASLALCRK